MKKIFLAWLFVLFLCTLTFAAKQVTLTTYYPAPFGMYQEMRVTDNLGVGTTNPIDTLQVGTPDPTERPTGPSVNIAVAIKDDLWVDGDIYAKGVGGWTRNAGGWLHPTIITDMVGIGITNPVSLLTVNNGSGAYSISGEMPVGLFATGTAREPALAAFSTAASSPVMLDAGNAALYAHAYKQVGDTNIGCAGYFAAGRTYFADNVGIGTTNPLAPLHVQRDSNPSVLFSASDENDPPNNWAVVALQGTTTAADVMFPNSSGGVYVDSSDDAYGVYQENQNSINYFNGNVGIGTTNPLCRLRINHGNVEYSAMDKYPVALITTTTLSKAGLVVLSHSLLGSYDLTSELANWDVALAAIGRNRAAYFDGTVMIRGTGSNLNVIGPVNAQTSITSLKAVKIGAEAGACGVDLAGALRVDSGHIEGCVYTNPNEPDPGLPTWHWKRLYL